MMPMTMLQALFSMHELAVTKEDETASPSGPSIGCFECPGAYGGI